MVDIENKIIKTKDIQKSMAEYANDNQVSPQECTFTINRVDTYVKESATDEFILIAKDILNQYTDKHRILNEHIEFNQIYTITAKKLKNNGLKLNYEIVLGDNATHPKIIIKSDSKIPYKKYAPKDMLLLLYAELNKIKASNSILINIFDKLTGH